MSTKKWAEGREFRNRWMRLKDLHRDHIAGKQLRHQLNVSDGQGESRLDVPGDKEALRFAQLIREFAHPEGSLFLPNLAATFAEAAALEPDEAKDLRDSCERIAGPSMLVVNDNRLTHSDIFALVTDGGLLREIPEQAERFRQLSGGLAHHPLLFSFHGYCHAVYDALAWIYGRLRELEENGVDIMPELPSLDRAECIYCRSSERAFTAVEHIYPESLGNRDFVLPIGAVCDECNNGVLSNLDQYLVEHDTIAFLRVLFVGVNPKTGKYQHAKSQGLELRRTGPREIAIHGHSLSKKEREAMRPRFREDGTVEFKMPIRGRRKFDPVQFGRSLYKIGLGLVAALKDHEAALDPRYDAARAFVLGQAEFRNYLFIGAGAPNHEIQSSFVVHDEAGTSVLLRIFGFFAFFNLEPHPLYDAEAAGKLPGGSLQAFPLFSETG